MGASLPHPECGERETPQNRDPQKPACVPRPPPWQGLGTCQGFAVQSSRLPPKIQTKEPLLPLFLHVKELRHPWGDTKPNASGLPAESILLCLNIILDIFPRCGWGQAGWAPRRGDSPEPPAGQCGCRGPLAGLSGSPLLTIFCFA